MVLPLQLQETSAGRFLPRDAFLKAARGRRVQVSVNGDRDFHGPLCNATAYFALGTVFLILVLIYLWNPRFLIATGFFYVVACMALTDIAASRRLTFYRVDTADGRDPVSYATPSLEDAQALAARVSR
ncbi:MAG: hypothetical protein AAFR55_00540 [Pseudomonadota bacterium]